MLYSYIISRPFLLEKARWFRRYQYIQGHRADADMQKASHRVMGLVIESAGKSNQKQSWRGQPVFVNLFGSLVYTQHRITLICRGPVMVILLSEHLVTIIAAAVESGGAVRRRGYLASTLIRCWQIILINRTRHCSSAPTFGAVGPEPSWRLIF